MRSTGERLGNYKIVSALGAGGMGEVYLAEDVRLNRKISLKFLSDKLTGNKDFLLRFEREAKAASALNHPNIVTIYEISEFDGDRHYIAMEYVEGDTLRALMKKRKFRLKEAIDIAVQIAAAIATAHQAGIVHRDIKPENIMIRPDGLIKILDFGLAKQLSVAEEVNNEATTRGHVSTLPGVVMGTVQYMSPEQIRAKAVDARTDIWSLGVVLYEMITGHLPFADENRSDVLAAILKTDPPPLGFYKPDAPPSLEKIIGRALSKDLDQRYQFASDFLSDLKSCRDELISVIETSDTIAFTTAGNFNRATDKKPPARTAKLAANRRLLWLTAPAIFLLLAVSYAAYRWQMSTASLPDNNAADLSITQLTSWKNSVGGEDLSRAQFSRDGKLIVFAANKNGNRNIWLKQIGGGEPFALNQEDSNATSPIFSPDGWQIAFYSERDGRGGIWTMPTLGGVPTILAEAKPSSRLVYWSKDNSTIYFERNGNLFAIDVGSKQISPVTDLEFNSIDRLFSFAPDGERVVYRDAVNGQTDLWIADKNGDNRVQLTNNAESESDSVWHPDGKRVIYSSKKNGVKQIFAAALNGQAPVQLTFDDDDRNVADISPDGTKILFQSTKDDSDIWGVRLDDGEEFQVTSDNGVEMWQDAAPNNDKIAYQASRTTSVGAKILNTKLFTQKTDGTQLLQIADDGFAPRWSPNGRHLAYLQTVAGKSKLLVVSAEGGDARVINTNDIPFTSYSKFPFNRVQTQEFQWSPDGASLIYTVIKSGVVNLWQSAADGSTQTPLTNNENKNLIFFTPTYSPGGKDFAWISREINAQKKIIWSVWLSENGEAQRIYQTENALDISGWSPNGNELLVLSIENAPMKPISAGVVSINRLSLDGELRPAAVLESAYAQNIRLSPDGKTLAFAARQDNKDVIQIMPVSGGTVKTLASSSDARVYFASLSWSPDSKTVYFGKQANWQTISILDNFK